MSLPVCTHAHLLRERLYHRGQWNDDPVRRVVDLCAECRAAFRAADIRLERANGSRWREPHFSVDPREPEGERHAPADELHSPAGGAGGGPRAADGPTTAEAATDPGGSPVEVDPAVRGTDAVTPGDGHLLDELGHRAMAAQVAPSSPSTGGEEGLPLPVEVEHSVPDEKKTCKAEEGCDRPVKAKGYCGSHYEKVFRRNGRGKVERPVAPEVQAKADEIEAERAAYADAKAALLEVRQALGPVLGLQEAEESAAVMASRVAQLVARLQAPPPVPPADSAEIRTLQQRYQVAEARLNLVRRHLAPLLGIHEEDDGAPEMAFRVKGLVARLQAATPATGRNLEEELAGAVADLEMTDARLRAWELWHQESEGGGNPTLLAGLLRLTRGARA